MLNDLEDLLPWARAGNLIFLGILLVYGWLAGRSLAGPWGGRLSVAFLACEPTVLAHSGLATTDVAVSACLLALVYHYRTAREPGSTAGRFRRFFLPTFWFAAAVLSKVSGIVYGPLCLMAVELERLLRSGAFFAAEERSRRILLILRRSALELASIMGMGLLLVCLYCGSSDGSAKARFMAHIEGMEDGPVRSILLPIAEQLPLFNNAPDAVRFQIRHNVDGHYGTFLMGRWHGGQTVWYYFPVALAIKLTVPLLVLPLLLVVQRPRSLVSWPCIAAAALLLFSVTCRVQIGVRFMLPLIAMAIVGLAAGCATACRHRPLFRFAVPIALLWSLMAAIAVWPHGLCYANELWGGTESRLSPAK